MQFKKCMACHDSPTSFPSSPGHQHALKVLQLVDEGHSTAEQHLRLDGAATAPQADLGHHGLRVTLAQAGGGGQRRAKVGQLLQYW